MKKLMSIITMLLVVIGISGCGNKVPTEVTVYPTGNIQFLEVGKDIAEGEYTYTVDGDSDFVSAQIITKGSSYYNEVKTSGSFGGKPESLANNFVLSDGEVLCVGVGKNQNSITFTKEK